MIKCLVNGFDVNYPCSPTCELFGDCTTIFETKKKASVRTNSDRIRAMTDEELAAILNAVSAYFGDCDRSLEINCNDCELIELCSLNEGEALNWLRQPEKEVRKMKENQCISECDMTLEEYKKRLLEAENRAFKAEVENKMLKECIVKMEMERHGIGYGK